VYSINPAVSPKLANETISKALKRATCHLWTVRAVMIGCMGVVIKESSCCSVENPKMQNGPLHDRASIPSCYPYWTCIYATYGPASVRFGGMTSGETLLSPRRLARVIIGLAYRPLHKRDPRHAQRTIELAPNKQQAAGSHKPCLAGSLVLGSCRAAS
jgi:hypothetical protein